MIQRIDEINSKDKFVVISIRMDFSEFTPGKMNYMTMGVKARDFLIKDIGKSLVILYQNKSKKPQLQEIIKENYDKGIWDGHDENAYSDLKTVMDIINSKVESIPIPIPKELYENRYKAPIVFDDEKELDEKKKINKKT